MKRRGFIQLAGAAVGLVEVPVAFGLVPIKREGGSYVEDHPPFRKEGALGFRGINADLSEAALEDAMCVLARDVSPKQHRNAVYVVYVHQDADISAARLLVEELASLRKHFPNNIPRFGLQIERSFKDKYEWGIVSSDGRCFYCAGC